MSNPFCIGSKGKSLAYTLFCIAFVFAVSAFAVGAVVAAVVEDVSPEKYAEIDTPPQDAGIRNDGVYWIDGIEVGFLRAELEKCIATGKAC